MLKDRAARPSGVPQQVSWTARVRWQDGLARATARGHDVALLAPLRFTPRGDAAPSALDLLLCALGGEVLSAFVAAAGRAGLTLDQTEAAVSAHLQNPLLAAGVIGESGSPALADAAVTVYASSPDSRAALEAALALALPRLPLHATLSKACPVRVYLVLVP